MNNKKITPFLAKVFYFTYPLSMLCTVPIIFIPAFSDPGTKPGGLALAIAVVSFILMFVAGWAWLISLGIIASRLGKSWISWCGLSVIFSPISPIIIYFLMIGNIKTALDQSPTSLTETA